MKTKTCKPNFRMQHFDNGGCQSTYIFKYGACQSCFIRWTQESDEGKEWLQKQTAYKMKKNQNQKKQEFRKQKREANVKGAMRLADMYFSRYIRVYYSVDGDCTCYTCGAINPVKEVDNGHYQKREHKATRYHENNCRPQCKTCNGDTKHNGKQDEFRVHLSNEIGEENVVEIEKLARTTIKASYAFYKDISDQYRFALNELQKEMGVKYW